MANVEALYRKCLKQMPKRSLSPTSVSHAFDSPFSVYCKYFVDPKEQDPPSEFQQLIAEEGKRHEAQVIKDLYPNAKELVYETPEEGFRMVLEAMFDGIESITQVPLYYSPDGLFGYADVLEKRDGKSVFGSHYYAVREIKSARNIRGRHKIQAAVYNYMLGMIQRKIPETFELINKDEELTEVEYSEMEQPMLKALKDLKAIVAGRLVPTPNWNNEDYPWETYSNKKAIELHDVSLVNSVGPSMKQKLAPLGIRTVKDLLKCPDKKLLEVNGVADAMLAKMKNSAKAINILKGASSYDLFQSHPNFRLRYPRGHFWGRGYFYRSVSNVDDETVSRYVREDNDPRQRRLT